MDEKQKQGQEGTGNLLTEKDKKYFCFYKKWCERRYDYKMEIVVRETVPCCCPFHLVQFNYFYN